MESVKVTPIITSEDYMDLYAKYEKEKKEKEKLLKALKIVETILQTLK